ncbi:DUF2914 domain-containing protein [Methylomicrobium sp. Wu6]|uniref:DUF2914 domain-containing protein n=1 Tax=Methylomicrobium sp. Wu6 TaxID=3107928 RepID=UPI002DD6583D|nr:DUF2914 domain-containing protein [Methylomicrobium sp. Wu6]MEC4750402.1 DUF2914 domain-containing protein [Methylomicrobium sp. Wu6]
MTDSKNIVIKVKYTAPDAAAELPPKMITEWNSKRIAGALGLVLLLLAAFFFWWNGKSGDTGSTSQQTATTEAPAPVPSVNAAKPQRPPAAPASIPAAASETLKPIQAPPAPVKASQGGRIRRAALAYRIVGKKPADLIGSTVRVRNGKPVPVYYFIEVRGKKDQTLFHEWLKDGQMILRHPLAVAAERWRTSSQRQLGLDDQGLWLVRTVDDKGSVMNEIQFTVSAK